jgi:hypothetical protein
MDDPIIGSGLLQLYLEDLVEHIEGSNSEGHSILWIKEVVVENEDELEENQETPRFRFPCRARRLIMETVELN